MSSIVTFGESMLRLSPPNNQRIEQAKSLDVFVAGAESNVAVAAQRLGGDAIWVSKLPDSSLGYKIQNQINKHGVTTDIIWSNEGRQGVYFVERGSAPRGINVIYDRDESAIRTIKNNELPMNRIRDAEMFYTSGITPALSQRLTATTKTALKEATEHDTTVTFDVNYRSKLWSPEEASETLSELFPLIDILIIANRDAEKVFELAGTAEETAFHFMENYDFETVIITQGEEGVLALHNEKVHEQEAFKTETLDPIGTGDAFVGAFCARRLAGDSISTALEYGAATASLKRTISGDLATVTLQEVSETIKTGSAESSR